MNKSNYYDYLHAIIYEDNKNVNSQGFVAANQVPFLKNSEAITFILTDCPDQRPEDYPIIQNKQQCADLAKIMYPEIERLKAVVDRMLKAAREKLDELAAHRDSIPTNSIFPSYELAKEKVIEQIGYISALHNVWQLLSDRAYELYMCKRLN